VPSRQQTPLRRRVNQAPGNARFAEVVPFAAAGRGHRARVCVTVGDDPAGACAERDLEALLSALAAQRRHGPAALGGVLVACVLVVDRPHADGFRIDDVGVYWSAFFSCPDRRRQHWPQPSFSSRVGDGTLIPMRVMRSARRPLAALAFAAVAVGAGAACEPASAGGLAAVSVAVTTDKTATRTFERLGIDVRWLSCTATIRGRGNTPAGATGAPSPAGSAVVDCRGETAADGDIRITGKVSDERAGRCVRGDLTARIDGRIAFQATMLGSCDAAATRTPTATRPPTVVPRPTVTRTHTPTPPATPSVTVTVTVTADPSTSAK
jgi:hypothetical protein